MDTAYFTPIIHWLHSHPNWGYTFAFIASFLESLALFGLIVPGSIIMTVAGILAGSGVLPLANIIFWSALGAFLGDYLSYGIGHYYRNDLKRIWPFKYFPNLLDKGQGFFEKYGIISVFTGRFIGPIRPIIPIVAGSLQMPARRFIPVDLIASILWPPVYMLPGFILGAASLALPPDASSRIIINLFILLIIICILYWLTKLFLGKIIQFVDTSVYRFWHFLKKHPHFSWLYHLLKATHIPDDHSQLGIALLACTAIILFIITSIFVIAHTGIFHLNAPVHHFFRSIFNTTLQQIVIGITFLGNPRSLLGLWFIVLVFFGWQRDWYAAIHWAILGVVTFSSVEILKHLIQSPRPGGLLVEPHGWSFPSGHTTVSTAIYSYLALSIAHDKESYIRYFCYSLAATVITLISFSRLYLGAHWVCDVIGGLLLGLSISLFVALSYRKTHRPQKNLKYLLVVLICSLILLWSYSFFRYFASYTKDFTPVWPSRTLTFQQWWQHGTGNKPMYRQDRLGHNIQTLNIEWLGNLAAIRKVLIAQKWHPKQKSWLLHTIHYFGEKDKNKVMPLFPALYQGNKPVLAMSKYNALSQHFVIIRLWKSQINIALAEASQFQKATTRKLFLGVINFHRAKKANLLKHKNDKLQIAMPNIPMNVLKQTIEKKFPDLCWKFLNYPNVKPLSNIEDSGWSGKILLISDECQNNE